MNDFIRGAGNVYSCFFFPHTTQVGAGTDEQKAQKYNKSVIKVIITALYSKSYDSFVCGIN